MFKLFICIWYSKDRMPKRTFRDKKSMRKTRRKRNTDELKHAYLMMNVGGKVQTYKLKKEKKNFKMHRGGMWPFSTPEPEPIFPSNESASTPIFTSDESPSLTFGHERTTTEAIQDNFNALTGTAQNGLASIKDGVLATSDKIANALKPKEESIVPTL